MKKRNHRFSIVLFIIIISLFTGREVLPQANTSPEYRVPGYLGVKIVFSDAENYGNFYNDSLNTEIMAKFDPLDIILVELGNRFLEAVEEFESQKKSLPSCLKVKMTEWFKDLKAGRKSLEILFIPGDFELLHKQCDTNGSCPDAGKIEIIQSYKEFFSYTHPITNKVSRRKTAATFLHELIHCVKMVDGYHCFFDLYRMKFTSGKLKGKSAAWLEEFSTDCCVRRIFGDDAATQYIDAHPNVHGEYCVYKYNCKCLEGCPKPGD